MLLAKLSSRWSHAAGERHAQTTAIINSFSQVLIDIFGASAGQHARTAIGVAALPLNLPVVVSAELLLTTRT